MYASRQLIEPCESRRLFSASLILNVAGAEVISLETAAIHAQAKYPVHNPQPITLQLQGSARGRYTLKQSNPDTGETFHFQGNGSLTPVGSLQVAGGVVSSGFIADGQSSGTLKLRIASGGTLTLQVVGPSQSGITPAPDVFNFTISAGTRKYAQASGSGYIALGRTSSPTAVTRLFSHGTFSMTFLIFPPP